MGQAKNKKLSGDILSKNYLEGIALDAFENGEITSLPESDKDLYESLKNLYEQKHRNIVDYLKWYRETNIKKAHGETIHKQVAKHFNQLPEPKAFGEFHEYNKFLIQEVSKVYESAVFKRALDNKIQKLYNQSYENPKPTIKAIFVPQYQSSMVRLNDILGFDAPGEKSQINKYEFK